jgi:hypothetical protein
MSDLSWSPSSVRLPAPVVSNRIDDLGLVAISVSPNGMYLIRDATPARAMAAAFTEAADLLDAAAGEGEGK